MNTTPASVEKMQKCVVNFKLYRFLKKAAKLPHSPLPTDRPSLEPRTDEVKRYSSCTEMAASWRRCCRRAWSAAVELNWRRCWPPPPACGEPIRIGRTPAQESSSCSAARMLSSSSGSHLCSDDDRDGKCL